jgi:hypothetical protein
MPKKVLSISGNDALRVTRHMMLESRGYDVVSAANLRETRNALKSGDFHLVILGISIEGRSSGKWPALLANFARRHQILGVVPHQPRGYGRRSSPIERRTRRGRSDNRSHSSWREDQGLASRLGDFRCFAVIFCVLFLRLGSRNVLRLEMVLGQSLFQ